MNREQWRDELHVLQASQTDHPELHDALGNSFLDQIEEEKHSVVTKEIYLPGYFTVALTCLSSFLAAVFFLSILLNTPAAAPVAFVGLLVILLAVPVLIRVAVARLLTRRYTREERHWEKAEPPPNILVRRYATDKSLQDDASRLARLGFEMTAESRVAGAAKLTYRQRDRAK